ncbi:MAG: hypothetical protein JXR84_09925 [Anaerolineae bacterium]|nr:hypothetical protein [Anaerolineae bacterium]
MLIWVGILILALSGCEQTTPTADIAPTATFSLPATATPTATAAPTIAPLFTETLPVKRATYYRFSARIYKASNDDLAYVDMGDMEEGLRLAVEPGVGGGQWTSVEGLWYSGERTRVDVHGMGEGNGTRFEALSLVEVTDMAKLRNSQIVTPVYPTDDIVVIDYNVLDYDADPEGVRDASDAIQRALDDCHHTGGGTVWMPVGTYKVTRTIFVWPFCTLRGDWRDPDIDSGDYGTVIQADVATGSDPLFLIGGSAATMGLTVYYPNQDATNPVPYGWTFEIRGNGWSGNANYHASSVIDCTVINAYQAIGVNAPPYQKSVHELSRVRNVKGTALYRGLDARNCADVGTWSHITFNNAYWATAPAAYNPPERATLDAWTRANGVAFTFSGLEWDNFYALSAADYDIGIHFVASDRIAFAGQFLFTEIRNTNVAFKAEETAIDHRRPEWGIACLRCALEGSTYAVENNAFGHMHLTDCALTGEIHSAYSRRVHVDEPGSAPDAYPEAEVPTVTRAVLFDVTQAPYNAPFVPPNTEGTLPTDDATSAIQQALDAAGAAGGGVVYLPAGWYHIATHLTVPANVELRGASATPHRSQDGLSDGTVLFAYEGEGAAVPEQEVALIALNGDRAGLRGLRVFYPHNSFADGTPLAYPYAIRINGSDAYVVNAVVENGHLGLDVQEGSDRYYIGSFFGATTSTFITLGAADAGRVEDCHSNPNFRPRNGYRISPWLTDAKALIEYRRDNVTLIYIDGATNARLLNNFIYAARYGVYTASGTVDVFNIGTDNLGSDGFTVFAEPGATVRVMNSMRYNGKENTSGTAVSYNELHL